MKPSNSPAGKVAQRARSRAYRDLAGEHPERFEELYNARRVELGLEPTRTLAPCGTRAAAVRHRNAGEEPCYRCRIAERAYARQRRAASEAGGGGDPWA